MEGVEAGRGNIKNIALALSSKLPQMGGNP